ncbi:MAG: GTP 3',8-cyclase MoaA [Prochlorothrix sp.]|nr:GTP 3',8-cyclase MoaA [Prochlorothrix sp.]
MPTIDYLRISLLDRCNFRCLYCVPEGEDLTYALRQNWLTIPEILTLVREVFIPLGFRRFRLTGGEPLLRPGLVDLVDQLTDLPEVEDLSMTTNGFHLATLAEPLYRAGLRRINISLDSLQPEVFDQIIGTREGKSRWPEVWAGIQAAHDVGFDPLKLNVVVIPGVNEGEVLDLAALSRDRRWHVRFIEFMPIGNGDLFGDRGWVDSAKIRQQIADRWGIIEGQVTGAGPADVFQIPGALGTVGFISQMSECFCDRCNRMRLSADGWLRPCLLNETGQIDLKTALRKGQPLSDLRDEIQALLAIKPEINFKERETGAEGRYRRTMSQIGG